MLKEDMDCIKSGMLHLDKALQIFENIKDVETKLILKEMARGLEVSCGRILDKITNQKGTLS